MLFKNLMLFQLTQPAEIYFPFFAEKFPARAFEPCGKTQATSIGFVAPADGELTHEQAGVIMFAVQIQEKKIPASALNDLVAEKVTAIEVEQPRKVYRKERLAIKDEIVQDKLPTVIPVNRRIYAYLDAQLNMLVIDAGSPSNAEKVANLIREAIGSFPLLIPEVNNSPTACMTHWLRNKALPDGFTPCQDVDLLELGEEGGKATCRGVDLFSEEVESHLDTGKQVTMLRVAWDESFTASIKSQNQIKSIRFFDRLAGEGRDEAEDEMDAFDADLAIMVGTLRKFVPALGAAFGGWLEQGHMNLQGEK